MSEGRVVRLKICKGINLAKKDIFGASDPYVTISVVDQNTGDDTYIGKTRTKKKTLNPTWNEEFVFPAGSGHKIVLETFDENRLTRDDFLGLIEIPADCIQEDNDGTLPPKDYLLHPRSARSRVRGYMRLKIAYVEADSVNEDDGEIDAELQEAQDAGFDVISTRNRQNRNRGTPPISDFDEQLQNIILEPIADNRNRHTVRQQSSEYDYDAQSESSLPAEESEGPTEESEIVPAEAAEPQEADSSPNLEPLGERAEGAIPIAEPEEEESDSSSSASTPTPTATTAPEIPPRASRPVPPPRNTMRQHRTDSIASEVSIATLSNEEPLPSGWEARVDNTGRVFYIDHINHRTQWERPSRTRQPELPSGWEERQDYNGRTYYVNHSTRQTQWQRPTGATASPTPEETQQQTTHDLATMYRNRRHISQEDTVEPSTPSTPVVQTPEEPEEAEAAAAVDPEEEPLPAGWAMAQTPNGRTFYINHNTRTTTWIDPRNQASVDTHLEVPETPVRRASSNEDLLKDLGPLPAGWEERLHTDGRIFYVNHMTRVTQWEDPRLEKFGGPAVPYSRDYKRKYDYFRSKLRKPNNVPNKIDIKVRRQNILEDSFNVITGVKRADLLKTRLWIEFDGETGLDYGGVAREWFYLLSKESFNPYYGLFEYSATDDYTLQINPNSGLANEAHLQYFSFIGRVAGMAVYHGKLLDGFFIRPFYKMMLGKQIMLRDMESVDSEYYNSLVWILENDPECLDLTFSVDEEYFGETMERELIAGGKDIAVTDRNKRQYIDLIIKWRFIERIKRQMMAFMDGFNDLIPHELIQIFDENELELLMCGLQDIDVKDWKTHTVYKGDYNPNHPVIINFWRACYSFNNEMRSRLLQFVTGTSRVPMNGFRELHGSNGPQLFTVEKWGRATQLPRAHTCFNRLDLPPYNTYEELRKKLLTAVESTEGFEGVD